MANLKHKAKRAGLAAIAVGSLLAGTSLAGEADYKQSKIIETAVVNGRTRVTIQLPPSTGLVPGDTGYLVNRDTNERTAGGGFELLGISARTATFDTGLTLDATRRQIPFVKPTMSCKTKGRAPDFSTSKDVALGKTPPKGFVFANILSRQVSGSTIKLSLDRGFDARLLPTSWVYAPMPGLGTPIPFKVEITEVQRDYARAVVKGVHGDGNKVAQQLTRVGAEQGRCTKRK